MAGQQVTLLPVDVADVTILVDILLPSDEVAQDECGDKVAFWVSLIRMQPDI